MCLTRINKETKETNNKTSRVYNFENINLYSSVLLENLSILFFDYFRIDFGKVKFNNISLGKYFHRKENLFTTSKHFHASQSIVNSKDFSSFFITRWHVNNFKNPSIELEQTILIRIKEQEKSSLVKCWTLKAFLSLSLSFSLLLIQETKEY